MPKTVLLMVDECAKTCIYDNVTFCGISKTCFSKKQNILLGLNIFFIHDIFTTLYIFINAKWIGTKDINLIEFFSKKNRIYYLIT